MLWRITYKYKLSPTRNKPRQWNDSDFSRFTVFVGFYFSPTQWQPEKKQTIFTVFQDYRNCFSREGSNFSSTPSSYNSNEFLAGAPSPSNPCLAIPNEIAKRAVHGDDSPGLPRSFSPPGMSKPVNIRRNHNRYPASAPGSATNSPGTGLGQASPRPRQRLGISRSNSIPGIGSTSSLYGM